MPTALGTIASGYKASAAPTLPVTSGLAGWWDASDLGLANGAAVTGLPDKSGNARHLTAPGATPIFVTNAQNGKSVVRWVDASTDRRLWYRSPLVDYKQFFAVAKYDGATFADWSGLLTSVTGSTGEIILIGNPGGTGWYSAVADWVYYKGGVLQTHPTLPAPMGTWDHFSITWTGWQWSVELQVGGDRDNSRFWKGDVGEVIAYNRTLSTVERQQVESYLTTKWLAPAAPIPTTGLQLWLDADDASTFTYSSGTVVSNWRDKSPNAHTFFNIGTVNRSGTQNGHPTVVIPGPGNYMKINTPVSTAITDITMVVAYKCTIGATDAVVAFNGDPAINGYGVAARADGAAVVGFLRGAIAWHGSTTPQPSTPCVQTLNQTDYKWNVWLNGTKTSAAADDLSAHTPTSSTLLPTHDFAGEIYEVIFYNRALSTVERQQVESYLSTKWGTPNPAIPTTGLVGWWDAADAATITPNGDAVQEWRDKSPVARHLNANGGWGVKTGTRTLNGRNVMDFSGVDYLTRSPNTGYGPYAQPVTMFIAIKLDSTADLGWFIDHVNGGPAMAVYQGKWALHGGSWIFGSTPDTNPHVLTGLLNSAGISESQLWVDGVSTMIGNTGGAGFAMGPGFGASTDCAIGEVIFYDRALSTVERQQVESYLKTKWGTP